VTLKLCGRSKRKRLQKRRPKSEDILERPSVFKGPPAGNLKVRLDHSIVFNKFPIHSLEWNTSPWRTHSRQRSSPSAEPMSRVFSSVPDIFELEAERGPELSASESRKVLQIDFSAEDPDSIYSHYDYSTVQRIQHSQKVLRNHSELVWHARQSGKSVAFTRSRFLAKTLPEWSPQLEKDLFYNRLHQQRIPDASVSMILVSPSNDFGDFAEVSRPGSLYSVGSASYTASPFKLPRQRTE
jgi:hypothetical protein